MRITEKHIRHFNSLHGKSISKQQLKTFRDAIQADVDAKRIDAHMPYGVECLDIVKRLSNAIKAMDGYKIIKQLNIERIKIKPHNLVVTQTEKGPVVKTKPKTKPARKRKPLPTAPVKRIAQKQFERKTVQKLSGVVSGEQIAQLQFSRIELDGKWKEDFLKLYSDTLIMIWGMPGQGKTVYLLLFAKFLAEKGLRVLYIANEEMQRSTLTEKVNEFKVWNKNLSFVRSLTELQRTGQTIDNFDVIFYDSINTLKMKLDDFEKFVEDHPGKCHVLVVQTTKDGKFKGGNDWLHFVDVAGTIVNRQLILKKNRLDAEFSKKSEKLEFENAVKEKEKRIAINEQVKSKFNKKSEPEPEPPVNADDVKQLAQTLTL